MTEDPTDEPKRGPGRPSQYPALEARVAALEAVIEGFEAEAVKIRDGGFMGRWAHKRIQERKLAARAARQT